MYTVSEGKKESYMGKMDGESYQRFMDEIQTRTDRSLASVASQFGVSREYARLCALKLGLPPRHQRSRQLKEREKSIANDRKHNRLARLIERHTSEYSAYCNAKQRCVNPKHPFWSRYGGRGIYFVFKDFRQFMEDIGPKPIPNLTLDRRDNDGNYEPGNIRWVTMKQNCQNREKPCNAEKSTQTSCKDGLVVV